MSENITEKEMLEKWENTRSLTVKLLCPHGMSHPFFCKKCHDEWCEEAKEHIRAYGAEVARKQNFVERLSIQCSRHALASIREVLSIPELENFPEVQRAIELASLALGESEPAWPRDGAREHY